MQSPAATQLNLILVITAPPPGVVFAVQSGRLDLVPPYASTPASLSFAITLSLGPPLPDGSFNFRGPFAQGAPADRFLYVNSGTYAGQLGCPWERRAKIKLAGIPRHLVETAAGDANSAIEGHVHGTAKDGGPVCASVPSLSINWRLVTRFQ